MMAAMVGLPAEFNVDLSIGFTSPLAFSQMFLTESRNIGRNAVVIFINKTTLDLKVFGFS